MISESTLAWKSAPSSHQPVPQVVGVGEVAVVGQRQVALGGSAPRWAGRSPARSRRRWSSARGPRRCGPAAWSSTASNTSDDQPARLVEPGPAPSSTAHDARRLLPAVLEGVQAEERQLGRVLHARDAHDAAPRGAGRQFVASWPRRRSRNLGTTPGYAALRGAPRRPRRRRPSVHDGGDGVRRPHRRPRRPARRPRRRASRMRNGPPAAPTVADPHARARRGARRRQHLSTSSASHETTIRPWASPKRSGARAAGRPPALTSTPTGARRPGGALGQRHARPPSAQSWAEWTRPRLRPWPARPAAAALLRGGPRRARPPPTRP